MNMYQGSRLGQILNYAHRLPTEARAIVAHAAMATRGATISPEDVNQLRVAVAAFSGALREVRHCNQGLLEGLDAAVAQTVKSAFTRRADAVLTCFLDMVREIDTEFRAERHVPVPQMRELMRFVVEDLQAVLTEIIEACRQAFEMGHKEAANLAYMDELTGLPNRRALHDIARRVEDAIRGGALVSVMHIDLDRFKNLNDTLGHAAGDAALRYAGSCISRQVREADFAARTGGDEFAIIFFDVPKEALADRAKTIIDDLSTPFRYKKKNCVIGGSVGIATSAVLKRPNFEVLLHNADLALYSAKNAGRGQHRFFTSELRTHRDHVDTLSDQIQQGIAKDQFEPFFQPQVEGRSGRLVGFEALIRWRHPERGLLTPFHFVPIAEEVDLLDALDDVVLHKTFAATQDWLQQGLEIPKISINISAGRLADARIVDTLKWTAEQYDLPPTMIGLEILESAMMDGHNGMMIANAVAMSDAGFRVELDDFGTGHASIANLRHFNVDRIKIDKSFVKDLHLYDNLSKITSAMISLAHDLRIETLAEGVETAEERLVLNALGCNHIQGFGVAKPMPKADVPAWIARTQTKRKLPSRHPHDRVQDAG